MVVESKFLLGVAGIKMKVKKCHETAEIKS